MYDVSVVLVNYNGGELLRRSVDAVRASNGVRTAVVVVDNASSDSSFLDLENDHHVQRASDMVLLQSGANVGFARGNNVALHSFPSRYICLLNADAIVEADTLGSMVGLLDEYPDIGICGPQLLSPDGSPQPFSHGSDPTPGYLVKRALARRARTSLHRWGGVAPVSVDWVAGTCMLIRREVVQQCGVLDARIFMYFEDNDLCLRARKAGWLVYFAPEARVMHLSFPSYADGTRQIAYANGLATFYQQHYGIAASLCIRMATRLRRALQGTNRA